MTAREWVRCVGPGCSGSVLYPPSRYGEQCSECKHHYPAETVAQLARPGGGHLVKLSTVRPVEVRWLWPGMIPLGKLVMLEGDPGLAKSTLTLDIAARVTCGDVMPDGSRGDLDEPRGVVLLGAEDGLADTVRPRLDAAGADASRVATLVGVVEGAEGGERLPTLEDLEPIGAAARAVDAALLVIDPVKAYLPTHADARSDQQVRTVLARLAALADERGLAVLLVRHLNKSGGSNVLYRGGDSIAFIAASRAALLVAADGQDPDRRILAWAKGNLSERGPSYAYRVRKVEGSGTRIEWEGVTPESADELLDQGSPSDRSASAEAAEWLRGELADGPRLAAELTKAGEKLGFTEKILRNARKRLRVTSRHKGHAREGGTWIWELPSEAQLTLPETQGALTDPRRPTSGTGRLGGPEGALGSGADFNGPDGAVAPVRPETESDS